MKTIALALALLTMNALAVDSFGQMTAEDQKYFKNDRMAGNNKLDRIDMNVMEINKLHGEINALKTEMASLKKEIEELKQKK